MAWRDCRHGRDGGGGIIRRLPDVPVRDDAGPAAQAPTAVGACAACCGAPLLLLAGVVALGVASTLSIAGGLLLLAALVVWATLTGRVGRLRRSRAASAPGATGPAVPVPGSCCADPDAAEASGDRPAE